MAQSRDDRYGNSRFDRIQSGRKLVGKEQLVLFPGHDSQRRLRIAHIGGVVARAERPHQQPRIMADENVGPRRIDGEKECRQMVEGMDADAIEKRSARMRGMKGLAYPPSGLTVGTNGPRKGDSITVRANIFPSGVAATWSA